MFVRPYSLPKLFTYNQAKSHAESIKPYVKGANKGHKPCGERNKPHLLIEDRKNGEVSIILYSTPVLTFYSDDTVKVRIGRWNTISTRALIGHVLDTYVTSWNDRAYIWSAVIQKDGKRIGGFFPIRDYAELRPCVLQWEHHQDAPSRVGWEYIDPKFPCVIRVDRKKARQLYAEFAEVFDYCQATAKLITAPHSGELLQHPSDITPEEANKHEAIKALRMISLDGRDDVMPIVAKYVLGECLLINQPRIFQRRTGGRVVHFRLISKRMKLIRRVLQQLLQTAFPETVSKKEVITTGKLVKGAFLETY